jgi:hypothetical protein
MSEARTDRDSMQQPTDRSAEPIRYPVNHVVGILDTPKQVTSAVEALLRGGFLDSEVEVDCGGPAAADRLRATTGRTGLLDAILRVAEALGVPHDETEVKHRYEQALRDGQFLVMVQALTDERKERAGQILREHGGHFINFLGRFAREELAP